MKNLKFTLLAVLILCAGSFLVWNSAVQAEDTVQAEDVQAVSAEPTVESLVLEPADEMMSSKIKIRPIEIEPVPLACGADSHADCKGLNHGDSCGAGGLGTCNASYPTDECLCL